MLIRPRALRSANDFKLGRLNELHAPVDQSLCELTVAITLIAARSASFSPLENSFDAQSDRLERNSLSTLGGEIRANSVAECNPLVNRFVSAV